MKELMKKTISLFLGALFFLCACTTETEEPKESALTEGAQASESEAPVINEEKEAEDTEAAKGFAVDGTKLFDANGEEFILRGINHAHTWFKDQLDTALPAIAETGANSVRIVLSDGGQWDKDSEESIRDIIEKCKALKLIAIVEVHDATGKNEAAPLEAAVDYWIEMKDALIGNEAYVILNIANEWYGDWKSDSWAKGYIAAIPRLREAGIKNVIMVDAAGWGQFGQSVADKGAEVFAADPLGNTMFSIHMYGSAGGSKSSIKRNIDGALSKGLCLCIGEFGYNHSDGDVDEAYIMEYCAETGVGYLGWSWKGNGGGVEYLDIAKEWDGSILSDDWGEPLINGKNGIRETAKPCSVFEN
ncbi:MAG: glycoside hydrolase family 5 protein [Bacteroides sp.]|nr:glycoside hydrolase family 5 protein [Eubacterium sp.]MCM1417826.1 glycoside hydrolase family 5 protein [Roseburia sp.]MCM1461265.1 glycoside hydrolase family 5 protein [Bacteroides sp.]